MATMVGVVERAKSLIPDFLLRRIDREPASNIVEFPSGKVRQFVESFVVAELPKIAERDLAANTPVDIADIAELALCADAAPLVERLNGLLARGMSVDALFVDVLAPTARYLGVLWEDDACDFVDVTMGLWRLQEVVRDYSARTASRRRAGAWRALFSPFPGAQHNFGTIMVEDVFRRDGWDTTLLLSVDQSELLKAVAAAQFDMVGLTVSCDDHIDALPSLLAAIRSVSGNPGLCIMLGGRAATADPDLVLRVGADCTAADAQSATEIAARFVSANACREVFVA